jgi:hypothetical protein
MPIGDKNFIIRYRNNDKPDQATDQKVRDFFKDKPEIVGDDELEKTDFEKECLKKLNQAAASCFEDDIDYVFPDEKLHVLDGKTMKEKFKDSDPARYRLSHICITRTDDKLKFISSLAHEIAHDLSFQRLPADIEHDDKIILKNITERVGFRTEGFGSGFNEGMTDYLASAIKKRYCDLMDMTDDEREIILHQNIGYYPQYLIIRELLEKAGGGDFESARQDLLRSYLFGYADGLKVLAKYFRDKGIPDGLKILFRMEATNESALETAEKLRLSEGLIREIKKLITSKENINDQ